MTSQNIIIIDNNDIVSIPGHTSGGWAVAMVDGDNAHVVTGLDKWSAKEVAEAMAGYDGGGEIGSECEIHTVRSFDADDIITEMIDGWFDGFWEWCRDTADEVAEQLTDDEGRADVIREIMSTMNQGLLLFSDEHMREAVTAWVGDGSGLLAEREEV